MKRSIKLWALALLLCGSMAACKKDSASSALEDITETKDNATVENNFNDLENLADEAKDNGSSMPSYRTEDQNSILSNCATVTRDTTSNPRVITIDFGTTNCLCRDGRYRRGKVLVSYSGAWRTPGAIHTITFDKYAVNDNQMFGSKIRRFDGPDGDQNYYWDVTVNGKMIPAGATDTVRWTANRRVTWVQGYGTPARLDDVYLITGSANGIGRNGLSWSYNIVTPLRKEIGCRWLTKGVVDITRADKPTRTLDYGNGSCDNIANVTVNGNTRQITLP